MGSFFLKFSRGSAICKAMQSLTFPIFGVKIDYPSKGLWDLLTWFDIENKGENKSWKFNFFRCFFIFENI